MAAVGDRYVVTLRAENTNEFGTFNTLNNVFAYEATSGSPTAEKCAFAFVEDVYPSIRALCSVITNFLDVYVVNLDDPSDFNTDIINQTGTVTGESTNGFTVWAFEYIRAVRIPNNGRKAFGNIAESDLVGGAPTGSAITRLNTLAGKLAGTISDPLADAVWTPRLWRRAGRYAPFTGTPPVGTLYPDTFYPIADVRFKRVSTQSSRKR